MQAKILIVEDEFPIALDIETRLKKMGYDIIGIANDYDSALKYLSSNKPDLVLLDINLEKGKNGIDLAGEINEKFSIPVVFLTAYSDNQTFNKAIKVNPGGYVIKPFENENLSRTIMLALSNHEKNLNPKPQNIKAIIEKNHIFIKDKGQIRKLDFDAILWIEAMDNYSIIHTKKENFVVGSFLKDVVEKMGSNFVRIHRSHAVAVDKITSIEDNVVYIGNLYLTIGKSYRSDLLDRITIL